MTEKCLFFPWAGVEGLSSVVLGDCPEKVQRRRRHAMLSSRDRGEVLQISPLLDGRENGESQDKARLACQKLIKKVREHL